MDYMTGYNFPSNDSGALETSLNSKISENWRTGEIMADTLQEKLDMALQEAISKIRALGYEPYDIIPHVRITNNSRRLGSAQDVNGAFARIRGKRNSTFLVEGKQPLFQISVARSECSDERDMMDVLLHEVIHTCPDCQNHGKQFKQIAAKANQTYGSNVQTTKKDPEAENRPNDRQDSVSKQQMMEALSGHIGESFSWNKRKFIFVGFNSKPKNFCDLKDKTGRDYSAPGLLVVKGLGLDV